MTRQDAIGMVFLVGAIADRAYKKKLGSHLQA
jgi:hypothetical protein